MAEYKITLNGTEYYLQVEKIGGGDEPLPAFGASGPALAPPPRAAAPRRAPAPAPAPARAAAPRQQAPAKPPAPAPQALAAPASHPASGGGTKEEITAPIPGKIIDVLVQEGQQVQKGDVLLLLEAMKMENQVVASENGVVSRILTSKGASVNSGDVLMILS